MRSARLVLTVVPVICLLGCLQAVGVHSPSDASTTSKPDAAVVAPDASAPRPDGGSACSLDTDCPSGSVCGLEAQDCTPHCVWGCHDSTQCAKNEACSKLKCNNACSCSVGVCIPVVTSCQTDLECVSGQICASNCDGTRSCAAGCRDANGCKAGEICVLGVVPKCDTYGQCETAPACQQDSDCAPGQVCDFGEPGTGSSLHCIEGCHDKSQCGASEQCVIDRCYNCPNCPCYGSCQTTAACQSDAECAPGMVCGSKLGACDFHCVPGCHLDAGCRPDQTCDLPLCLADCGCDVGVCKAKVEGCQNNSECATGQVCAYDDTFACQGTKHCVDGCLSNADCADGGSCALASCGPCCPGQCVVPPSCTDATCGAGKVCEPCGASGEMTCVTGCHSAGDCAPGKICGQMDCFGFCCPPMCIAAPATCQNDWECGLGMVCEGASPAGVKTCIPGCRDSATCKSGEICMQVYCGVAPCPAQCMPAPTSCQADAECGLGMVCELDAGCKTPKKCVRGCHDTSQCQAGQTCSTGQPCLTCPCPNQCETPACLMDQPSCATTLDCAWGSDFCQGGCCTSCPEYPPLPCPANSCPAPSGTDGNGCPMAPTCGSCCDCPMDFSPVCSTDFRTFGNSCELACAGATALHAGACLTFEGLDCGTSGVICPLGQYCRNLCPTCESGIFRCTEVGVCEYKGDCPAGLPTPVCPNGQPTAWSCTDHACVTSCP